MNKLILSLMFLSSSAFAEVVFDGYYKIETDGKPVGFAVRRVEVDAAKKTRTLKIFVHTVDSAKKVREDKLVAVSNSNLHPIESDYTSTTDGKTEHVVVKSDGKTFDVGGTKSPVLADEVFATSALNLLVNDKPKKGTFYSYMGVRESKGTTSRGQILVINEKAMGKLQVYRVVDFFENPPVETWIASNGEILKEIVPKKKAVATLVKNADAAIGALTFDRSTLKKVFDEIPAGSKNVLANTVFPEFPELYPIHYTFEPYATALKLGK